MSYLGKTDAEEAVIERALAWWAAETDMPEEEAAFCDFEDAVSLLEEERRMLRLALDNARKTTP